MNDTIKTWVRRLKVGDKIRCIKELLGCKPGCVETIVRLRPDDGHRKAAVSFTMEDRDWSCWLEDLPSYFEPTFHTNGLHGLEPEHYWMDAIKPGDKVRLIETDREGCYGSVGDEFEFAGLGDAFQESFEEAYRHKNRDRFGSLKVIGRKGSMLYPFAWRFEPVINAPTPIEVEPAKPTLRSLIEAKLLAALPQQVAE